MCASFELAAVCSGGPKSHAVHPAPTHTASAGRALQIIREGSAHSRKRQQTAQVWDGFELYLVTFIFF